MTGLTFDEIERIGKWEPYQSDWPVNRNLDIDHSGETNRYGGLKKAFNKNDKFELIELHDGGSSNFIQYICFRSNVRFQQIDAIAVFINLCAPIATYSQIKFTPYIHGLNQPEAKDLRNITSKNLKAIESEIITILFDNDVTVLETNFLDQDLLPGLIIEENLLEGQKLFNYLFQWID